MPGFFGLHVHITLDTLAGADQRTPTWRDALPGKSRLHADRLADGLLDCGSPTRGMSALGSGIIRDRGCAGDQ